LTGIHTFQAANTIRAVGTFIDFDLRGTVFLTIAAQGADVFVDKHPKEACFVEEPEYSPKRAGCSAEGPLGENHPC
jgi:hypothetical protein